MGGVKEGNRDVGRGTGREAAKILGVCETVMVLVNDFDSFLVN